MAQINIFDNFPVIGDYGLGNPGGGNSNTILLQYIYIPGTISVNTIALIGQRVGAVANGSYSYSLGLYSLNGATLSLANSASQTYTFSAAHISWITLVLSTTGNTISGEWFAGFKGNSSSNSMNLYCANTALSFTNGAYGGPFFRGLITATNFPSSIATSDCSKEGSTTNVDDQSHPYILIGA